MMMHSHVGAGSPLQRDSSLVSAAPVQRWHALLYLNLCIVLGCSCWAMETHKAQSVGYTVALTVHHHTALISNTELKPKY